jgi:hypothetical protein
VLSLEVFPPGAASDAAPGPGGKKKKKKKKKQRVLKFKFHLSKASKSFAK